MQMAEDTDVMDREIDAEADELKDEQTEGEQQLNDGEQAEEDKADEVADEVVVTIGEESPPSEEVDNRAPEWVRELRKSNREKDRRIRELEARVSATTPAEKAVEVGTKPSLEGCDYDAERFEREIEAWHARKRDADAADAKKREAAEAEQRSWQAKLDAHNKLKGELKVKDYEDAEAAVESTLSVTQRGVIVHGADNSALVFYALGKNPKKAAELASIADPVKFAFAVAKLEKDLKVTPRKAAPLPEKTVRGTAPASGTVDSTLERLRSEAEKTGNYTKVHQYRQQQRTRGK